MTVNCPYCGKPIAVTKAAERGGWSQLQPLEFAVNSPWAHDLPERDFAEYERMEPVRAATWESDGLGLLGQSLGSGVFVALFAGALAVWHGWQLTAKGRSCFVALAEDAT